MCNRDVGMEEDVKYEFINVARLRPGDVCVGYVGTYPVDVNVVRFVVSARTCGNVMLVGVLDHSANLFYEARWSCNNQVAVVLRA